MSFDRQLQDFVANPDNLNAFEALEEQLFISGQWDELVEVYRTRVSAPSLADEPRSQAKLLFRLAQILEERCQDLEQAERTYWEVARLDSRFAPAVRQLRRLHAAREQWDVVLQLAEVEEQLPLKPYERAEYWVDIGRVWLRHMDEPGQALECFDKALEVQAEHHDALAGRATALEALDRLDEASRAWSALSELQRGPDRAPTLVAWAKLLAGPLSDPDRAIEIYRRALTEDSRNEAAVEALAVLAGTRGQWELVRDLFERRFDLASGARRRTGIALEAGHLYLERFNEPQMARIWFNRALELCPDDIGVHQSIAKLERMAGNDSALAASLEHVVDLAGRTAPVSALLETANLRSERGDEEAALELLRLANQRAPENPMVLEALSDSLTRLGHVEELAEILDQRAALASDDPELQVDALCELGRLHEEQLSDASAALDAYARAFALRPDAPEVASRLERLYRKAEDWSEMRRFLERAAELGPEAERLGFRCSFGALLAERFDDFDGAAIAYESVLDADPSEARALKGLERIAQRSGDEEALLRVYQREAGVTTERSRMAFLARELLRALESRDRVGEAIPWLERWAEACPEDREPLEALARIQEAAGNDRDLVRTLERLDALLGGQDQAALRRRLAARQSEPEQQVRWLERALESHPGDVEALACLRDVHREAGRIEDQARVQRRLAELLPPDQKARCLDDLSRLLEHDLGDVDGAVVVLWRLRELPDAPEDTTERLEGLLERVGRDEELAQLLLERRRGLPGDSPDVDRIDLKRASLLLERLGQAEEATEVLRAVRERHPGHPEATEALEKALRTRNDSLALAALLDERAREESDPRLREARELESATLLEEGGGDVQRARETYERLADGAVDTEVGRQAAARLESMLERSGDWRGLCGRLEGRLPGLPDDEALALRERLAVLYRDRLGDRDACIAHLEAAGSLAPERDGAWRSLGLLYREADRRDDWARVIEAELRTGPSIDREQSLRASAAQLARDADRREQARDHYERLLELDPAHEEASEFLIGQYELEERPADVVRLLDARLAALAQETGNDATALRLRIASLRADALDDPGTAIAVLESGLTDAGSEALLAEPLADLYQRCGRSDDLVALCRRRSEQSQARAERAGWLMRLGDALRAGGDGEAAAEAYRGVLAARPGDRDAAAVLRVLAREQGDAESLAELLRMQLDPAAGDDPLPVLVELADLLAGPLDRPDEALDLYQRALAIAPDHAGAFRRAVELASQLDRHDDLLTLLDERLAGHLVASDRAALLCRRGELLAGPLDRPDEAPPVFREALSFDRGCREAHRGLRAVLERLERWPTVLDCLFVESGEADPAEREAIYETAAQIAGERISRDAALPWLERLRRQRPDDPSVVSRIAEIHRQAGRPESLLRALDDELALATSERRGELLLERARVLERDLDSPGRAVCALEEARAEFGDEPRFLETLVRLYAATGRTRERALAMEKRLAIGLAGRDAGGAHRELADLWEHDLREPERALTHRLQAVARSPEKSREWVERVAELRGVLWSTDRREAWTRAAEMELAARREADERDPEIAPLRECLARVYGEELGRRRAALVHWRALVDGGAGDDGALRSRAESALIEGLRRAGEPVELEARLGARLESGGQAAADLAAWMELARLREERLQQPAAAARAYARATLVDERALDAWRGLHRTSERLGDWSEVARCLEREAELTRAVASPEGAALWRRIGDVAWHRLGDPERAHAAYARALEADGRDLRSLRSLASLAERRGDWSAELDHSERELEILGEEDAPRRAALWLRVGTLARDRAGDCRRALAAFEASDAALPLEGARQREWAELYREVGDAPRFAEVFAAWCDAPDSGAGEVDHLELARALETQGRPGAALDRALRATELAPRSDEAWQQVARLLEEAGEPRAAGEAYEKAASLQDPAEGARRLLRAAELVERFDPSLALSRLRNAAALDPAGPAAGAALARVALAAESYEEAERAAAAALDGACACADVSPEQRAAVARIGGRAARARGRSEAATRFFSAALADAPQDREALAGLGEAAFESGDETGARRALEQLQAIDPGRIDAHQLAVIGIAWEREGDAEVARERFEAALALDPGHADAHAGCVRVHECAGEVEAALGALARWVESTDDPARRAELLLRRARLAEDSARPEEALESWRRACDADPQLGPAWAEWAERLWRDECPEEALEVARRGRERAADDAAVGARLAWVEGCALEAADRSGDAAEAYAEVVRLDPRATRAALARARLLRATGDWARASRSLESFALEHPDPQHLDLAEVWVERGRLLAGPLEDVDEALRCYERALAIDPDRVEALEPMARLLEHVPERESESVELHSRLLALDPARAGSLRALGAIASRRDDRLGREAGLSLLRALGAASPAEASEAPRGLPLRLAEAPTLSDATAESVRRLVQETGREIADALGLPVGHDVPDGRSEEEIGFLVAFAEERDRLGAPGLSSLADDELARVLFQVSATVLSRPAASQDDELAAALERKLGLWSRRRLRRMLDGVSLEAIERIDPTRWREELTRLAAEAALDRIGGDLRTALVALALDPAEPLPADSADISDLVRRSPAARALLLRATAAWCEHIQRVRSTRAR
ncbi:MAG: tetratricopeptide repeat protein [Myxococcota bacterium]